MKKKPTSSRLQLPDDLQALVEKREQADRRAKRGKGSATGGESAAERRKETRRSDDATGSKR